MSSGKEEYGDIFDRPHHVSSKRPQMSRLNRAAQFSPFAALTGYDDLVRESARTTDRKIELSEDDLADINRKLKLMQEHLSESPQISVIFFAPDSLKSGGEYLEKVGVVKKVKILAQSLLMEDGMEIPFSDIVFLSGALFEDIDESGQIECGDPCHPRG
jgi:hypothetical protein